MMATSSYIHWEPAVREIASGQRGSAVLDRFSARTLVSVLDSCDDVNRRFLLALPVRQAMRAAFQAICISRVN